MKLLLGAAVLAAITLAASACESSHGARDGSMTLIGSNSVSESRLIENGTVRCTARVLTTPVEAGRPLGAARVVLGFRNLTKRKASIWDEEGSAVVTSPDGTTYDPLWETRHSPGGLFLPIPLRPGATKKWHVFLPRVSWEGPLRITPSCNGAALPPVRVTVTSPGLPANARTAVNDVVIATGHLLNHCRPRAPGVSVVGQIDSPTADLQSFRARCSVSLRRERGFYVAQLLVVTPPDMQGVRILPTYEATTGPDTWGRNTQTIAWKFVVTRSGATPIDNFTGTTAAAHRVWMRPSDEADGVPLCGPNSAGNSENHRPDVFFLSSHCVPQRG